MKREREKRQCFQSFINVSEGDVSVTEICCGPPIDSGASAIVCGVNWMKMSTNMPQEGENIQTESCYQTFRFGDGDTVISIEKKNLLITLCGEDTMLWNTWFRTMYV